VLHPKIFENKTLDPVSEIPHLLQNDIKTTLPGPNGRKHNRFKPYIGNDLIVCASRRNNILTAAIYQKEGRYSLEEVEQYYGSFDQACTDLQIINPDNVEDYAMVITDIRNVYDFCRKINAEIYKDNGAYPFDAVDKRYGFQHILIKEGLAPVSSMYPSYPIRRMGLSVKTKSVLTHNKRLYSY
jgi:hypothetical protein